MTSDHLYILDASGEPVPEPDLIKWGHWFEDPRHRIVARDQLGPLTVSTVFLGVDHNFLPDGPPILWETMVFDADRRDLHMDRCAGSREQAIAMHASILRNLATLASP